MVKCNCTHYHPLPHHHHGLRYGYTRLDLFAIRNCLSLRKTNHPPPPTPDDPHPLNVQFQLSNDRVQHNIQSQTSRQTLLQSSNGTWSLCINLGMH